MGQWVQKFSELIRMHRRRKEQVKIKTRQGWIDPFPFSAWPFKAPWPQPAFRTDQDVQKKKRTGKKKNRRGSTDPFPISAWPFKASWPQPAPSPWPSHSHTPPPLPGSRCRTQGHQRWSGEGYAGSSPSQAQTPPAGHSGSMTTSAAGWTACKVHRKEEWDCEWELVQKTQTPLSYLPGQKDLQDKFTVAKQSDCKQWCLDSHAWEVVQNPQTPLSYLPGIEGSAR